MKNSRGGSHIWNGYGCKARAPTGWGIRWEHRLKKWGVIGWEHDFWHPVREKSKNMRSYWSKNEGSLGESTIFFIRWVKFGIRWEKNKKIMGSLGESTCDYKKMRGLWVTAMLKKGVFWALHTRHLQNGTAPPWEKLCNFELLLFEMGITYLTSFLIYCRKNCALSVSINNQPRINVRKNRCSSNHTQLCFMWKSENKINGI